MAGHHHRPRILIFSTAYFPFVGGAEVAVKEITDRLPDFDFDLITVNLNGRAKSIETIGRVTVYRVGWGTIGKFILPILGIIQALLLARKHSYSLVWGIMASQAGITAALYKKIFFNRPFLLTLQEGDEESHLMRYVFGNQLLYQILIRPWYLFVLHQADHITVLSDYLRKRALVAGVTVPITTIPNGVDLELFKPVPNKFILDYKLIVTTSRLVFKNNVDTLIRAMEHLPETVRLAVIGDGPDHDKLARLIDELDLGERVELVGYRNQVDMLAYLRQADVFVRVSRSEGLGNSFLEAMAVKVPVVASRVGGITDFLKERETGWFADPSNPGDIAAKVSYILNSDNREEVMSVIDQAYAVVTSEYTWESVTLRIRPIFDLLTK